MNTVVGRVTIKGTEGQVTAIKPFIVRADKLLGQRYDAFDLEFREREDMPIAGKTEAGKIIRSEGRWSSRTRKMLLATDLLDRPMLLDKTCGHEWFHTLQSDWFGRWHRRQLLPLLTPLADDWSDLTIGDEWLGYIADPVEAMACWGSAALFGWDKPAYSTLYKRRVLATNFARCKQLSLATAP